MHSTHSPDNLVENDEIDSHIKPALVASILKTIRFYDLFDFPLKIDEVQNYLYAYKDPLHIKELRATLEYMVKEGQLELIKEYCLLPNRQMLIDTRKGRKFIAEKFWNRSKLYGQYMRAVPFVKMISICNNLSYDNPSEQSDIDLFIVIKPGRMWLARFFITLILQFYGVRRHGQHVVGRFCLSFFVTENKLAMSELALKPEDPYLAYWTKNLTPIYGEACYETFKEKNEGWLKTYNLAFTDHQKRHMYFYKERKTKRFAEWVFGGIVGNFAEWLLKQTFKRRTLSRSKKLGPKSNVVVSDDMLKFHDHDRRREFYERWKS